MYGPFQHGDSARWFPERQPARASLHLQVGRRAKGAMASRSVPRIIGSGGHPMGTVKRCVTGAFLAIQGVGMCLLLEDCTGLAWRGRRR